MRGEVSSPTAAVEAGEGGGEGGGGDGGTAGPVMVGGADGNWVPRRPAQLVELLIEVRSGYKLSWAYTRTLAYQRACADLPPSLYLCLCTCL